MSSRLYYRFSEEHRAAAAARARAEGYGMCSGGVSYVWRRSHLWLPQFFPATPLPAQHVSAPVVVRGGPLPGAWRWTMDIPATVVPRAEWWSSVMRRHGYREVIVYYINGRYYDSGDWRYPRAYQVVVYERDGRFFRDDRDRDDWDGRD